MKIFYKLPLLLIPVVVFTSQISIKAQEIKDFTMTSQVKTTPVKSQDATGTCWSYATISFIETEALRKGKEEFDLSEMYPVRFEYLSKAQYYLRLQGKANFSQGGQAHDVIDAARDFGLVPNSVYTGLKNNETRHNHFTLETTLKNILDSLLKTQGQKLLPSWKSAITKTLDSYLGPVPESFIYKGKTYTPQRFSREVVGFDPEEYVELTSFSHHPFYKPFDLEVPDNWAHAKYYNLPISELLQVMDFALNNGYSVDWDGDVSERGFKHNMGIAVITHDDSMAIKNSTMQDYRQVTFDNFSTTDDHLMHVTGLAKDKAGNKYYHTKNSWGPRSNEFGGYLYMSEAYVQLKTIAILVNKNAIPKDIARKIGL